MDASSSFLNTETPYVPYPLINYPGDDVDIGNLCREVDSLVSEFNQEHPKLDTQLKWEALNTFLTQIEDFCGVPPEDQPFMNQAKKTIAVFCNYVSIFGTMKSLDLCVSSHITGTASMLPQDDLIVDGNLKVFGLTNLLIPFIIPGATCEENKEFAKYCEQTNADYLT